MEWHPPLLGVRRRLEATFEAELRARFAPPAVEDDFAEAFFSYVADYDGPSLAAHVQRRCDREQVLELLRWRSVYHLKESDATAWVVPRLPTRPKAALWSCSSTSTVPATRTGCTPTSSRSDVRRRAERRVRRLRRRRPVEILEQNNAMSLFGLHRRLRGAALGHLAAFEATSSMPARRISQGLARLGMPQELVAYYDEHVLADAAHEQQAVRDICGALLEDEPGLTDDVFLGAFAAMDLEARVAHRALAEWGVDD